MRIHEFWREIVDDLSSKPFGTEVLNSLLKDLARYLLEHASKESKLLKRIAFYRLYKSPEDALALINSISNHVSHRDIDKLLASVRPLKISEETLLDSLTTIRKAEKSSYRARRASIRLLASYLLAHPQSFFSAEEVLDASVGVGDIEAYRAALYVQRGFPKDSLLSQTVGEKLYSLPEEKIPHGAVISIFSSLSRAFKLGSERKISVEEKSVGRCLEKFKREFSSAGRTAHTASFFDRIRILSRTSSYDFASESYPISLLELEKLFVETLKADGSEAFKSIRPLVRGLLDKANAEGALITSKDRLPQTFITPIEDRLIGIRYRGREIGRFATRLLSFLLPELKDIIVLSDEYPETLYGIHSIYPEEIYVGRYIHVGVEAYVYGKENMVKTKNRIFRRTLTNLVEKFIEDERSTAKAYSRSISILEGRSFIRGLSPEGVRKHESASLYHQISPVIELIEDRLVRLYAFMRLLRSAREGIFLKTLYGKGSFFYIRPIVQRDVEDLVPIIRASMHTLSEQESGIIKLLALSFSLLALDAFMAIRRIATIRNLPTEQSRRFYAYYKSLEPLIEELKTLAIEASKEIDTFRIVEYPKYYPIFYIVIRRYQIIEGLRRAAIYGYLYGDYELLDRFKEFLDARSLTAMEPRIIREDPDVIVTVLPVIGGKKRFKLKVGTQAAPESRRRLL